MKQIHRVDANGFYVESLIVQDDYVLGSNETEETPINMQVPKWDGKKWVESDPAMANYAYGEYLKDEIKEQYEIEMEKLLSKYSKYEQKTWATQLEQAKLYVNDNTAITPALDELSAVRNIPKDVLANKIISKAQALELTSIKLTAKYQKLLSDITTLQNKKSTQSAYANIKW